MKRDKRTKIIIAAAFLILVGGVLLLIIRSEPDVTVTFAGYERNSAIALAITNRSGQRVMCSWQDRRFLYEKNEKFGDVYWDFDHNPYVHSYPKRNA